MNERMGTISYIIATLILIGFMSSTVAQEISIPDAELNAAIRATLQKPVGPLTEQDLLSLTSLNACCRNVTSLQGLEAARNLIRLSLDHNLLTDFSIADGMTNLLRLDLSFNSLTNVSLPNGLTTLATLLIEGNQLTSLTLPENLPALVKLDLDANRLTALTLPPDLRSLVSLNLAENQLTSLALPAGMTNMGGLFLFSNQLTSFTLPAGLTNLNSLILAENLLTDLVLPAGLTKLTTLDLTGNQSTTITLPPDMQQLAGFFVTENPLTTLVLSEQLATTKLAGEVAALRNQGVSVFTYPLTIQLISPRRTPGGAFGFALTGPPGSYTVLGSADLATWSELGTATNLLGSTVFADATAGLSAQKFYRLRQ